MEISLASKKSKIKYMRDERLREWLNQRVNEGDLSHREIAKRMGVSHTKVSRFLNGQDLAGFEFCVAISRYYKRSPLQILSMAGLVPHIRENDESIDEVINIMRSMNEEERRLILETIRGFWKGIQREESDGT